MATTFVEYTGDGNATKQFTFPSYQESDVKVRVDGVLKTTSTHYNITNYTTTGGGNVVFTSGNIPSSPANIRIYRDTNVDVAKATFTAGSSVKAADLNNNTTQLLYRAQEEQIPNLIHSYDIADNAIKTDKIDPNAVTTAKIADDAITSAKLATNAVTTSKIANANITGAKLAQNSVGTGMIANNAVTTAKIAADAIDSSKIADDAIASEHIGNGAINSSAMIANNVVTSAEIANNTIVEGNIADSQVTANKIGTNAVTTTKIADSNVTTAKIAADAVTNAKIADDSIDSEHYVDGSIDTAHIGNSQVTTAKIADSNITTAKIASNAVTTDKIADSELSTLAGMQSATASKLADSTALTADIADLNQIDGMAKQTTITDDDTKFPTSGAVVDYVAAQLEPFGGFEAIANESSFPNTQPASGVAISIADAGGMTVSSSGTASGATVGGTTVNISGIPSNFFSSTVSAGVRFIVTSTGSGQNYTYHKATLKEDDLLNLSGDINDFSERYRVGSSNPTSSLDSGDLFFNTGTGKLLVYNGTNSAWEEAQSVGNFFINTISSSSATGGGSATPNGTAYRFTLSNAGTNAEQHLVSVDGVVQKPNSGSSQPSEGFAVSGADIIFGSAPVSGASIFVITLGSTVNIGVPSNNTVTSAILQNGSVTTAKIVDANVTSAKIANSSITQAKLVGGAVTGSVLADNAVVNDKVASNAAIAGTKISPNFGSQNIVTSGEIETNSILKVSSLEPRIRLIDGNNNPNYSIYNQNGAFKIFDETSAVDRFVINGTDGHVDIDGNLDVGNGLDVTGDVTVTSTAPTIDLVDTNANDDFQIRVNAGNFAINDTTNSTNRFLIDSSGTVDISGNLDVGAGLDVTGNLGINVTSPDSPLEVGGTGPSLATIHHTDGSTNDEARLMLGALSSNPPDQRGAGISARNKGAGHDLEIQTSSTHSAGPSTKVIVTAGGQLQVPNDSVGLQLGAGQDLQIFHNGTNSIIENVTGALVIKPDGLMRIQDRTTDEFRADFNDNGSVDLYYNGSKKFETTSNGTKITGVIEIDRGSAIDEALVINTTGTNGASRITFKESGTSKGELAYSHGNDQVELVAKTGNGAAIIVNVNQTALQINSSGHVRKPLNPIFHAFGGPANVATNTDIVFGQERFDVGGGYNTSNGVYTVPVTGYYHFYGQVYRQTTSADSWWGFYINGSQKSEARLQTNYNQASGTGQGYATLQSSIYWYCSAGDTVKMRVGAAGAIHCNNTLSYFCGNLVG